LCSDLSDFLVKFSDFFPLIRARSQFFGGKSGPKNGEDFLFLENKIYSFRPKNRLENWRNLFLLLLLLFIFLEKALFGQKDRLENC